MRRPLQGQRPPRRGAAGRVCAFDSSGRPANDFSYAGLTRESVEAFLQRLKRAVRANDRQAVASLVAFPTETRLRGTGPLVVIQTAPDFMKNYDAIMTKRILDEVRNATVETLSANWQGVSIGRGSVWFNGVCEDESCATAEVLITRLNSHEYRSRVLGNGPQRLLNSHVQRGDGGGAF